jgi:hypothetical protein
MTHQFLLNLATVLFLAFSIIITTTDGFIPAAPACISRSSELGTTKTTKKNISRRRILRLAEVGGTNEFYDDLKRRIKAETNPYSNIFAAADHEVSTVHIISFALGTSRQGIHSIEFPKGSGNNVVLAFESREACAKFAEHLRAQHFFDPTVSFVVCKKQGMMMVGAVKALSFRWTQKRIVLYFLLVCSLKKYF